MVLLPQLYTHSRQNSSKKKNEESINEDLVRRNGLRIRGSNEEKIQVETKAYAAKSSKFLKRKPQRGSDEKKPNRESKSHENLRCYRCLEFGHIGRHSMMIVDSETYLSNDPYFKTDKNSLILDNGSSNDPYFKTDKNSLILDNGSTNQSHVLLSI
ncbi:hypothetical protein QE152_g1466 [Popillia japonica]|uniref:Uncharacterized protein n=1 Tax=Popillia japonica TaxID=7064 RepID=A0AAW1N786_POPJA